MSKVMVVCVVAVVAASCCVVDVSVLAVVLAFGVRVAVVGFVFAVVVGLRVLVLVLLGGSAQVEAGELVEGKVEACGGVGLAAWSANKQRQRRCLVLIL
ncbi:hypothetical protein [Actinomyces glycerinitolerans]|uniref:hypothetical protein n=1 Tax=Actinomyces glycerinitolerans TaxID=1892869 RepID=UPI000934EB63|nr:hypothetical protein [Actinomyces glycerinitolerans]